MSDDTKLNDNEIACTGIDYLVNNDWESCQNLFQKHK